MRAVRAALAVALFVWLSPTAAWASSPTSGVHTDPGSPAGKQYVLPISSARGETSGGQSSSSSPPLFGAGVTPGASAASSAGRKAGSGKASGAKRRGTKRGAISTRNTTLKLAGSAVRPSSRTISASTPAGGTSWLPLLGGGALVLLIGGGSGLALRRRL